jgi:UDP-N-acetylglucosamine--N-acetylmuramyl-(pentapeptide) pyrophosphoryl-undecaprenol N-acetylglucosamine transferase
MTIYLVAGGTGGHVFPAIALYEELHFREHVVEFITDERGTKYFDTQYTTHILKLQYNSSDRLNKIKLLFRIFVSTIRTIKLLYNTKPVVVIGFGGYQTAPALAAAVILNIPIALYEPNSILGKANKFFKFFAKKVAVSYYLSLRASDSERGNPASRTDKMDCRVGAGAPPRNDDNFVLIGPLVRSDIKNIKRKERPDDIFRIFIFGGSQGAAIFSDIIPKSLKLLPSGIKLHITQQADAKNKAALENLYSDLKISCDLAEFFPNVADIYSNTDLVIARSGASTISELSCAGIPSILIPYPYAADNHQLYNALALEKQGGAICIRQSDLTPKALADKLLLLINRPDVLKQMSQNLQKTQNNSAAVFADTVEKIIK